MRTHVHSTLSTKVFASFAHLVFANAADADKYLVGAHASAALIWRLQVIGEHAFSFNVWLFLMSKLTHPWGRLAIVPGLTDELRRLFFSII
jgi:hypothetical protein